MLLFCLKLQGMGKENLKKVKTMRKIKLYTEEYLYYKDIKNFGTN